VDDAIQEGLGHEMRADPIEAADESSRLANQACRADQSLHVSVEPRGSLPDSAVNLATSRNPHHCEEPKLLVCG
jgi:hypothetical protein